jgi:hypothetical protein
VFGSNFGDISSKTWVDIVKFEARLPLADDPTCATAGTATSLWHRCSICQVSRPCRRRRVEYHVGPALFSQQALLPPSLSAPKHESGPLSRQQILLAFLVCALPCSYGTTRSTIRRPSRAPYHHPKGTRPRIGTARILTSISAAPTTIAS